MTTKLRGIDIAKWDGGGLLPYHTLEWENYHWEYAFIKASEGTVADPLFKRQWIAARGHVLRGAYHYFRPFVDPYNAVLALLELMDGDLGELPMVFDLESTDNMKNEDVVARSFAWLTEYERRTRVRPIIYSSPGFLSGIDADLYPKFRNYKLFLAQYLFDNWSDVPRTLKLSNILNEVSALPIPEKPAPFTQMPFVQWTSRGDPKDVPGYFLGSGHKLAVDFIRYTGDARDFATEFGISPITKNVPPLINGDNDMSTLYQGTVIAEGLRVRPAPNLSNTPYTTMPKNTIVEALIVQNGWWNMITINGLPVTRPSWSYEGDSKGFIRTDRILEDIVPIPVPVPVPAEVNIDFTFVVSSPGHVSQTVMISLPPT